MSFYGVIVAATLIGIALGFTKLDSIKALFWPAVVSRLWQWMRMAVNPRVMEQFVISRHLRIAGWLAAVMMAVVVLMIFAQLTGLSNRPRKRSAAGQMKAERDLVVHVALVPVGGSYRLSLITA